MRMCCTPLYRAWRMQCDRAPDTLTTDHAKISSASGIPSITVRVSVCLWTDSDEQRKHSLK
jgi:hypothetical protein